MSSKRFNKLPKETKKLKSELFEKLIPEVKGLIIDKKNYLIKYFKSKRKGVNNIYRIHYDYCYNFLKNE